MLRLPFLPSFNFYFFFIQLIMYWVISLSNIIAFYCVEKLTLTWNQRSWFPGPLCPLLAGYVLSCCVRLFCDPMDCSPPGSLSMGFSRQEYWSDLTFPPPGDLADPGIEPVSPALAGRFFTAELIWKALTSGWPSARYWTSLSLLPNL